MTEPLQLEFAAVPHELPSARRAITGLCQELRLDGELARDVRLAVTEACSSCVQHSAAGAAREPTFVLEASVEGDSLLVVVRDFGGGLVRAPAPIGGLGLGSQLIGFLADDTDVSSRPGGGMRVAMRFALTHGVGAAGRFETAPSGHMAA